MRPSEPALWMIDPNPEEKPPHHDSPVPIVFTGSQRSADRPSSDNVMNAVCAVEAAKADHAETLVCMHASASDDACALHRGTRVRKNHTSRRDAFETVGAAPLGLIDYEAAAEAGAEGDAADAAIEWHREPLPRGDGDGDSSGGADAVSVAPDLDGDVELV